MSTRFNFVNILKWSFLIFIKKYKCKTVQPFLVGSFWKMDSMKIFLNAQSIEVVNRISPGVDSGDCLDVVDPI